MVLESTMICVDASEYTRDGDYFPTRLEAERDAVNLVVQCKLRANAENNVGLLAMTDRNDVLSTLTQDNGKIFMKLHQLSPKGCCNPVQAIRIAHLALKHRQNRNHRPRIIVFIGSPLSSDISEFVKTAKKLKKEKVNVDVISFGGDEKDAEKLQAFVDTLNGKEGTGSHLVNVPPGSSLQETLLSSTILRSEDGGGPSNLASLGGGDFEFGVDPNEDPELAMALRVSLEEQRQRQEREAEEQQRQQETKTEPMNIDSTETLPAVDNYSGASTPSYLDTMSEDEQVLMALQLSLQEPPKKGGETSDESTNKDEKKTESREEPMDTDDAAGISCQKDAESAGRPSKPDENDNGAKGKKTVDVDPKAVQKLLYDMVTAKKADDEKAKVRNQKDDQKKKDDQKDDQ